MRGEYRHYSRVYWSILDDDKFDGIRENPAVLGSWLLLLVTADSLYPAPALLPAVVSRKHVALLAAKGLIDLLPGGRYRVHGLEAERDRRTSQARRAADARWNARSNP